MRKKVKKQLSIIILFFLIPNILFAKNTVLQNIKKFGEIFKKIKRLHISNPASDTLIINAIKGMINGLDDPYTVYMGKKTKNRFQEHIKSHFGGLGISIGKYTDEKKDTYIQIISLLNVENCPAKKAGLKDKDIILAIDDYDAKNISFEIARKKLRGPVGSEVFLTVRRDSEVEPLKIKVIRDEIKLPQSFNKILDNNIGYIRLLSFSELSSAEIKKHLITVVDSGVVGIILDLRNNPGGLLTAAVNIVNYLIDEKKIVVYTKDKTGKITSEYFTEPGCITKLPMVLLVNENSASASEIVTGALKAHKRAVIIGKKTFGKGSVQNIFNLPDGSGIKLTIAHYFTPEHICIHKIGIKPDIEVELTDETKKDLQLEFAKKILKLNYKLYSSKNEK